MRRVANDMGGRIGGGQLLCLSAFSGIGGLDLTAAGDALEWTLGCFERGRLRPMIARAGYHSVADGLDESAVTAALPEIVSSARAIVQARNA